MRKMAVGIAILAAPAVAVAAGSIATVGASDPFLHPLQADDVKTLRTQAAIDLAVAQVSDRRSASVTLADSGGATGRGGS